MSHVSHRTRLISLSLKAFALIGLTSSLACNRQADVESRLDNREITSTDQANTPSRLCRATDTVYFADTPLGEREGWYGKHLRAMKEPVLCPDSMRERYRFLWLRTFHRPIAVRVEQRPDDIRLVAKELDGAGGYGPGTIVRDTSFSLPRAQWEEFRHLLSEAQFWQLPAHWPPEEGVVGVDGSQWILEGVAGEHYHVVDRWTPEHDPRDVAFRRAVLFLLSASTIKPRDTEIY
jgi:hypothetical protein